MPAGPGLLVILGLGLPGCGPGSADERPGRPPASQGRLPGAGGISLHYEVVGEGADTLVVVHGGPGAGSKSVAPFLAPLADDHTLVFYDQRGGGLSELPADTTKLDATWFIEDLEAVRRHFGLERMKIVAHSFGALLAAEYAREHPDRIERMVFLGATGPSLREARAIARRSSTGGASADSAARRRVAELIRELLSGASDDPVDTCRAYERTAADLAPPGAREEPWPGTTCDYPSEAVRYSYHRTQRLTPRSLGAWDYTDALREVEAPLLVIHGDADSLELEPQRQWARAVPRGRLLIAGKGHKSGRADIVLPAIGTFMAGGWPAGATRVVPESEAP
ncbi:MAG: alpha/beta fold hydrolase [Gemmatimonadota bacterium]|nr:alpha/beta fold hydrolase [Gemmatimonadota bacterium]